MSVLVKQCCWFSCVCLAVHTKLGQPCIVLHLALAVGSWKNTNPKQVYIYCRASHTSDAGRGRGREERGGCQLNLRTWHAEGRRPILGLCWPSLGLCWPILRLCWPMPMRTKCCNLQHFALWDGKNPCKYHSFSPRKWLKHSYLQSFVHIAIFDFLKNV